MTAPGRDLAVAWLGRVPYRAAWDLQERLRARIVDGNAAAETVLLLEHPPVVTLGRSADPAHVLLDDAALARAGIDRVPTSRGGDVTYHGPGQLVAYAVVRLGKGVVAHVEALCNAACDVAATMGIEARFRRDRPGAWVGDRKLAAVGVHVAHRVAIHGLALNVTTPDSAFASIVPCGLHGVRTVALVDLAPHLDLSPASLATVLGAAIAARLGRVARPLADGEIRSLLS